MVIGLLFRCQIGVPISVRRLGGEELDMGMIIREVLRDGDHVIVTPSLKRESICSSTLC
jgi:hypothetical protein